MTPTSNVFFPQQMGPITLPKMIRILFVIKSINAVIIKPGLISGWNSSTKPGVKCNTCDTETKLKSKE